MQENERKQLRAYFPDIGEDAFWGFTCFSRQEYADLVPRDCVDRIMLGIQSREGGCYCEMGICWHNLGSCIAPQIECFDDAWAMLLTARFRELVQRLLAGGRNLTPEQISHILIDCGFADMSDNPLPEKTEKRQGGNKNA